MCTERVSLKYLQSFKEIEQQSTLKRFISSPLGTLYFQPELSVAQQVLIRHLDGALTVELLPVYVDLYHAIKAWIKADITLSIYAASPEIEVGVDYIKWPFYAYHVSVFNYLQDPSDEHYVEPPELYTEMTEEVTDMLSQPMTGKDSILQRILRRSLLEPTHKTIYQEERLLFMLVEPKLTLEDLEAWKVLIS